MSNSIEQGKISGAKLRELGHDVIDSGIKEGHLPEKFDSIFHAFIDSVMDNFVEKGDVLTTETFVECGVIDIHVLTTLFPEELTVRMFAQIFQVWLMAIPLYGEAKE